MPNRLLKEGIVDSDRINGLSPEAEVCFYRLLVVSDDLGRMDARPAIVRARCFPLKEQSNLISKIEIWLEELSKAGLISRYLVENRPYLMIANWDQRVRSSGKYPAPVDGQLTVTRHTDDGQVTASGGLGLGKGKGLGASKQNDVLFEAASGSWSVPDMLQSKWGEAYPALSLGNELSSAAAWLIANPKNQKSNYARFLTNWLSRAQDKAGRAGGGTSAHNANSWAGAIN